jgi:hypothetical protein
MSQKASAAVCGGIAASVIATLLAAGFNRADNKKMPVLQIGTTETFVEETVPEGSDETAVEGICRQLRGSNF